MHYTTSFSLPVAATAVWELLTDVRQWPGWTPTVESVHAAGPITEAGQNVTLKQPGRNPVRYTVDVFEPGHRFRWGSARGGVRQAADHVITPEGPRSCTVRLSFTMTGPVGGLLGRLGAGKIKSMVDEEAAALSRRLTGEGQHQP
ncbi:SRPBCC family protein [Amycolatopsis acidicola]|uniref:SRPBCC family protein n=1 Tax=Amycolatopsis acidicola TaxID=2596893 RepID=UPI00140B59C5|nr:SRPBCC family protein [Amycolatopsis acidicola]